MKILVATEEKQGKRSNDFNWCKEGEPVVPGMFECDSGYVDDDCGCKRSLCGLGTLKATTTFKVVEAEHNLLNLLKEVKEHLIKGDWQKVMPIERLEEIAHDMLQMNLEIASTEEAGAVFERRGEDFFVR